MKLKPFFCYFLGVLLPYTLLVYFAHLPGTVSMIGSLILAYYAGMFHGYFESRDEIEIAKLKHDSNVARYLRIIVTLLARVDTKEDQGEDEVRAHDPVVA